MVTAESGTEKQQVDGGPVVEVLLVMPPRAHRLPLGESTDLTAIRDLIAAELRAGVPEVHPRE